MKRVAVLLLVCFLLMEIVVADVPGNTPREEVKVLVLLGELNGYTIYANGPYASYGDDKEVNDSSEHILDGGYGAPPCISFFGINSQDQYTDTVMICNHEQGNVTLKLWVEQGKLLSEESNEPVRDETLPLVTGSPGAEEPQPGFFRKPVNVLVIAAFSAMLLLVALYYYSQRKKQAV